MRLRGSIIIALTVCVICCSLTVLGNGYAQGFDEGRRAGWEDSDGTRHFVAGFALSVYYVGYCLIDPPSSPPSWRVDTVASESSEYQEGYVEGYMKGWQARRIRNALGGALSWVAILLLLAGY